MKLPNAEIEQAASPEASRYTLQAVLLDVEAKRLVATDGHILASIPAESIEQDHRGLISTDTLKQARKMQKAAKADAEIVVNGKATVTAGNQSATFELATGNFPNWQMVMAKTDGPATITLDVNKLIRLAKALDSRDRKDRNGQLIVSLWIKDAQSGVAVKASKSPDALGVIMPCRP